MPTAILPVLACAACKTRENHFDLVSDVSPDVIYSQCVRGRSFHPAGAESASDANCKQLWPPVEPQPNVSIRALLTMIYPVPRVLASFASCFIFRRNFTKRRPETRTSSARERWRAARAPRSSLIDSDSIFRYCLIKDGGKGRQLETEPIRPSRMS